MKQLFYTKGKDGKANVEFSLELDDKDLTNILLLDSIVHNSTVYKIILSSYDADNKVYVIIVQKTNY